MKIFSMMRKSATVLLPYIVVSSVERVNFHSAEFLMVIYAVGLVIGSDNSIVVVVEADK